ncbi:cadmium-translocating P-type ATPase [Rhodoplanes elegans]|uniref:P-type Zn(2+) transporter n=1 Tax=Rhodoplanes elegans TaxID=29408 RepID=A0A327KMQ0_9BRAD|nr:heavy metal translocating P-type ATPase [Rhodoplanes elegans]MBK5958237.1 cadmium-translocating P-type ATPase [Rhodoplanes elegans]RAI40170.1 cadmium-translocating P-type ATPase [Rhodoplanes elegans]
MSDVVETRYRVTGMDCGSCAAKVQTAVSRLPGVAAVAVSTTSGTMTVTHPPGTASLPTLRQSLTALGYDVAPLDAPAAADAADAAHDHAHDRGDAEDGPWWRGRKATLPLACGAALAAAYAAGQLVPAIETWAFLAALAIGLVPIARRALAAARAGTPFSIEMLMTIAAVGAVLIGATEEAAMVVFLFLVGELLEGVAAGRARASIRSLSALVPKTALVERNGVTEEVPAATLAVGAVILVRPGDRIAADGVVVDGRAAVDESPVTGESVPVQKAPGDTVFAGAIVTDAVLRVRVTATATDNTIARVVRLVEEAQDAKAPTERLIDRFARWYTPAVVAVAAIVAVAPPLLLGAAWGEWIYKGLALLLIGCPCALVISTPAAIAAALSAGARHGLLVKGGAVLETLGTIRHAALDKTGTLTEGKPRVTDLVAVGRSERQVLSMAAALETGSNHPLALAILSRAKAEGAPVPPAAGVTALAGEGVFGRLGGEPLFLGSARAAAARAAFSEALRANVETFEQDGKTVAVLLAGDAVAGLIAMRDEPRPDAKAGLRALEAAGVAPVMLTGDNPRTAAAIAADLGIPARGGLLPEDKQRIVRELQASGGAVAKIGDGINDAPALAAADVGIAMGGGTDVALETADAAVLHGRVMDVARLVALSRAATANIRQNIVVALGLKAVFLVTTIAGITGLWPAILADTGATVLVTANAMRLLAWRM